MLKHHHWNRRAGRIISVLYLLIFTWFELYTAIGTAFDKTSGLPRWESGLGWTLLVLPGTLLASLVFLRGKRPKLGFSIIIVNLCLYASFMAFESLAFDGPPVRPHTVWELLGIWVALFLAAVLTARFLYVTAPTKHAYSPRVCGNNE